MRVVVLPQVAYDEGQLMEGTRDEVQRRIATVAGQGQSDPATIGGSSRHPPRQSAQSRAGSTRAELGLRCEAGPGPGCSDRSVRDMRRSGQWGRAGAEEEGPRAEGEVSHASTFFDC